MHDIMDLQSFSKKENERTQEEKEMKVIRRTAAVLLAAAIAVMSVAGCGASFDASAYLKAILDNSYKHDSTALVEQKLGTKEEAEEIYRQGIDNNLAQLGEMVLNDEVKAELESIFEQIYAKADYTVGEAEKQKDNSYVVTVTYRPMTLFTEIETAFDAVLDEKSTEIAEEIMNGAEYSDEELEQLAVDLYLDVCKEALADVQYGDEKSMVVRIELNDKTYTPNETDIENLEYALLGLNE